LKFEISDLRSQGARVQNSKVTVDAIRAMKGREPIAALTAYDYPLTRLLDEAGTPLILVGDSLGMVVLGYPDTTHVTMADMEHHVRAAARARPSALLAADLPYGSIDRGTGGGQRPAIGGGGGGGREGRGRAGGGGQVAAMVGRGAGDRAFGDAAAECAWSSGVIGSRAGGRRNGRHCSRMRMRWWRRVCLRSCSSW
jgi:hypothetical protein